MIEVPLTSNQPYYLMSLLLGAILTSSPSLIDPHFEKTEILIVEHNEKGAMGFILNSKHPRKLNELIEFNDCPPLSMYTGGPVDQEHLFFIHLRPDLIEGGTHIKEGVYLGGNFKQAIEQLKLNQLKYHQVKVFVGYAGWDTNQLEEEIAEGSWFTTSQTCKQLFMH